MSNLDNGKRLTAAGAAVLLSALLAAPPAEAGRAADDFAQTLGGDERRRFEAWYSAQIFFDASLDAYWDKVEAKRAQRRAKRRRGQAFRDRDYVTDYPPKYSGPQIPASLLGRWRQFRDIHHRRRPRCHRR